MRIFLLSLVFPFVVLSQPIPVVMRQCQVLFLSQNETQKLQRKNETALNRQIKTVKLYLGNLKVQEVTEIQLVSQLFDSNSNPVNRVIQIGQKDFHFRSINPKTAEAVLFHEYGHHIFEQNLLADMPKYKDFFNLFVLDSTKVVPLKPYHHEVVQMLWNLRSAVHEIFCDVVAVTVVGDSEAIFDSVRSTPNDFLKYNPNELNQRAFDRKSKNLPYKAWQKQIQNGESDIYFYFLPVRWAFWELSKNKMKTQKQRQQLIPLTYQILFDFINKAMNSNDPNLIDLSRPENIIRMNQEMIEQMEKVFGASQ